MQPFDETSNPKATKERQFCAALDFRNLAEGQWGLVRAAGLEPAQRFLTEGFSYQLRLSPPRLRALAHRRVCGLDYTFTVARSRFRCRPSSLYTFAPVDRPVRLARDCQVKGFPEFGQFCIPGFPGSTQVASSPLRLPVPPRPH